MKSNDRAANIELLLQKSTADQQSIFQRLLNDAALTTETAALREKFELIQEILEGIENQFEDTSKKTSNEALLYRWWIHYLRNAESFASNIFFRRNMLTQFSKSIPLNRIELAVYPYQSFYFKRENATIQLHECFDLLSAEQCETLAAALVKKPKGGYKKLITGFCKANPKIDELIQETRQLKKSSSNKDKPKGSVYDLDNLFEKCNKKMFKGEVPRPKVLYWSAKRNRTIMGKYNYTEDSLMLNRALDSREVPEYVPDTVMYHELLHKVLGTKESSSGKTMAHTAEFRRLERAHPDYERAQEFLQKYTKTIK